MNEEKTSDEKKVQDKIIDPENKKEEGKNNDAVDNLNEKNENIKDQLHLTNRSSSPDAEISTYFSRVLNKGHDIPSEGNNTVDNNTINNKQNEENSFDGVGGGNEENELNSSSEIPCLSSSLDERNDTNLPTYEEAVNIGDPPNYYESNRGAAASSSESPFFGFDRIRSVPKIPAIEYAPVVIPDVSDENGHTYVGLVNQAMTCYLNSLIQSLYMTPEFRNALFTWENSDLRSTDPCKSISFQLQKLFLLLLTSDQRALETKALTMSFGWNSNEAYDQHDVQEFCHIMFDALEHTWRKSNHKDLISKFYRGKIEDFVQCLNCNNERVKEDLFLDIPLTIKKFGSTYSFSSIEQCLKDFTTPEILNGNNKYQCEQCQSKQDAKKGLRYKTFPYILSMQLKRFDFNYENCSRIKLNDRVTFPDFLDLNSFIGDNNGNNKCSTESLTEEDTIKTSNEDDGPDLYGGTIIENEVVFCEPEMKEEKVKQLLKNGPYVYELFSVMVHQGNASGGHYFAYIKNMEQNRWFCFNDSNVSIANFQNIYDTFGSTSFRWGVNQSNAYMLMYRRVDEKLNEKFTKPLDLPPHLIEMQEKLLEEDRIMIEQQRIQDSLVTCLVKINLIRTPSCNRDADMAPFQLTYPPDTSLEFIHQDIVRNFPRFFEDYIGKPFKCTTETSRLLLCRSHNFDIMPYPEGIQFDTSVLSDINQEVLNEDARNRPEIFFLFDVIWEGYNDFLSYDSETNTNEIGVNLCLCLVDLDPTFQLGSLCQLDFAQKFYILENLKVSDLKRRISALLGFTYEDFEEQNDMRLIVEYCSEKFYESDYTHLDNDNMTMREIYDKYNYCQACHPIIYADCKKLSEDTLRDRELELSKSRYFKILVRKKFGHLVTVHFPDAKIRKRYGLSDFHNNLMYHDDDVTDSSSSLNYLPMDSKDSIGEEPSDNENSSTPSIGSDMSPNANNSANRSPIISDCERDSANGDRGDDSPYYNNIEEKMNLMSGSFSLKVGAKDECEWNTEDISNTNTHTQFSMENNYSQTYQSQNEPLNEPCFVDLVCENFTSNSAIFLIDRRGKLRDVCSKLSKYFEIPLSNFKLNRLTRDHTGILSTSYPICIESTSCIGDLLDSGDDLQIGLKLNLKKGEESVSVSLIQLNKDTIETTTAYCEIALSKNSTYEDAKNKLLKNIYTIDGLAFDGTRLRFLQFKDEKFSKITSISEFLDHTFVSRQTPCIYVQVFDEGDTPSIEANKNDWHFMYARRWLPSSSGFSDLINVPIPPPYKDDPLPYNKYNSNTHNYAVDEVPFDPSAKRRKPSQFYDDVSSSYLQTVEEHIVELLTQREGIKRKDLEFTKIFPSSSTDKWPFNIGKLSFIDQHIEFQNKLTFKRFTKNLDGCVVYFRDATEQSAEICPDRRKELYIEEKRHTTINVSRRVERPLRIKISTSISEN